MFPRELDQVPHHTRSASFRERLKKSIPQGQDGHPREQLEEALERIALSAPHILADIGFLRDLRECSPERTVWRQGSLRVTISTAGRSVSISRF
jgi:4-hydroxyphenylpyruvate dioxygenase-like putative hemolysin